MGMSAKLYQITPQQLSDFLRRPSTAYDYAMAPLFEDSSIVQGVEDMFGELRRKASSLPPAFRAEVERVAQQFQSKSAARKGPQLVKPRPEPEPARKEFSLEKDWHVLHYVLNGTREGGSGTLAQAVLPSKEIPDVERVSGYGPIRYLTPGEVASIAAALRQVDPNELLSSVNVADAQAKKIYLAHTLDDLTNWAYFPKFFTDFSAFYSDATACGNALLMWVA